MDRYFEKSKRVLKVDELHNIGVTCMFIASKYEDITPLFMQTIIDKVTHGKMTKK